jgi:hypothetical protein
MQANEAVQKSSPLVVCRQQITCCLKGVAAYFRYLCKIEGAHLPRVEGVSGALTQQCAGASVFLGSPIRITFFGKFADGVTSEAIRSFQQVVARALQCVTFGQNHSKIVLLGPNHHM